MRDFTVYTRAFLDCLSENMSFIQYLHSNCGISAKKHSVFLQKAILC